jgi:hypothetical protein
MNKLEAVNRTMDQLELEFFNGGQGQRTQAEVMEYTKKIGLLQELRESLYWERMRAEGKLK